jgi:hypothetical protein
MRRGRSYEAGVLLHDGRVLVVGGEGDIGNTVASAELYDPVKGRWTIAGKMHTARRGHTAVVLADGRVLVLGGWNLADRAGPPLFGELFDPAVRTWKRTSGMTRWRYRPLAVLLRDGRVLVAGGYTENLVNSRTADLYDPVTDTWKKARTMRAFPTTATVLADGRVLVTHSETAAEVFDPHTDRWSLAPGLRQRTSWSQTTLLWGGDVLAISFDRAEKARAVRYDPLRGVTTPTRIPKTGHGPATPLADGTVLVAGPDAFARYDPATDHWITLKMPPLPRDYWLPQGGTGGPGRVWADLLIPLLDGRALVTEGGSTAIYDPLGD